MRALNNTPRRSLALGPAFTIAFAAGAASIVCAEVLDDQKLGRWIGTLGPLLSMAIYLVSARHALSSNTSNTREQVADSVYFMGFMFTLLALSSALFAITTIDTTTIVSRFSLALSTTLFGLLVKVLMTQFSTDSENRQRRLEDRLGASMSAFQLELDTSATLLNQHMEAVKARIEGMTQASFEQMNELAASHRENARSQSDAFVQSVETRLTALADHAEEQDKRVDEHLSKIGQRVEQALSELSGNIDVAGEKIRIGGGRIGDQLHAHATMIEGLVNRLQPIEALLIDEQRRHVDVERIEAARQEMQEEARASTRQLAGLLDALGKGAERSSLSLGTAISASGHEIVESIRSGLPTPESQERHDAERREVVGAIRLATQKLTGLLDTLEQSSERSTENLSATIMKSSGAIIQTMRNSTSANVDLNPIQARLESVGEDIASIKQIVDRSTLLSNAMNEENIEIGQRSWMGWLRPRKAA